jgi:hypothetical protein
MKIISFAWTTEAFLAGRKTRTRRDWAYNYASRFHVGDLCQAWNYSPRVKSKNPHRIGTLKITGLKYEALSAVEPEDFEKEGFAYLEEKGLTVNGWTPRHIYEQWRMDDTKMWVVDFVKESTP